MSCSIGVKNSTGLRTKRLAEFCSCFKDAASKACSFTLFVNDGRTNSFNDCARRDAMVCVFPINTTVEKRNRFKSTRKTLKSMLELFCRSQIWETRAKHNNRTRFKHRNKIIYIRQKPTKQNSLHNNNQIKSNLTFKQSRVNCCQSGQSLTIDTNMVFKFSEFDLIVIIEICFFRCLCKQGRKDKRRANNNNNNSGGDSRQQSKRSRSNAEGEYISVDVWQKPLADHGFAICSFRRM